MRATACAVLLMLAGPAEAQDHDEAAFVAGLFRDLQPISFRKGREHCGFLGRDANGALVATPPVLGELDSCTPQWPDGIEVLATYHTHGSANPGYFHELPSAADLLSDRSMGVDGWIATPGGRLWFVDGARMMARQVCGPGCLPVAPGAHKNQPGEVAKGYSFDGLVARLSL